MIEFIIAVVSVVAYSLIGGLVYAKLEDMSLDKDFKLGRFEDAKFSCGMAGTFWFIGALPVYFAFDRRLKRNRKAREEKEHEELLMKEGL